MARNANVSVSAGAWTQLTADDAIYITLQNLHANQTIYIKGATSASAPTDLEGAIKVGPGEGFENATLAELFRGLTSPVRVYAFTYYEAVPVAVSHD